jgi:hypothetical protein
MKEKTFSTYIKKYQFQPYSRLFDGSIAKYIKTEFTNKEATLYAIVKAPKIRYIPESFYPVDNYSVVGNISVHGEIHEIMINIAKTWFDTDSNLSQQFQSDYNSIDDFTSSHMKKYDQNQLKCSELYKQLVEVDLELSDASSLLIKCPISVAGSDGNFTHATLPIYQMINQFDISCFDELEIQYIGKSTSGAFERLRKHEKWGPISAKSDSEHEYLVYFFEIDESVISKNQLNNINFIVSTNNDLPSEQISLICEASLINFYKPEFNEDHKSVDLKKSKLLGKWLIENCYTELVTEVELEGMMGRLGTPFRPYTERHEINLPLK